MKSLMLCSRITALAVASVLVVAGALILAGCDLAGSNTERITCESRTGNSMAARVNGEALCTDIGAALLSNVDVPRLSVFAVFRTGHGIAFSVANPAEGTFDLTDLTYGTGDESVDFFVNERDGSGSVTITSLTDTRVQGTFAFDAVGFDVESGAPTGTRARATDGTFDFALASEM